ncbi:ABC transporter ATP-binding protein [Paenarthrobacter sp. A20]|uniref:ABC transporter ATP-binding protein n=1 Tax=Paenarthrobacter sp. A20 TaxID=2817891 RepID=UPI00209F7D2C|nr:ATP-binding cassette domain-containing protein [Paenarthrobacter sp. A20]MCP1412898.1 ABC-type lipoprotein export system ATPase subunit [Paenarthrobacter sp. A20]
MTAHPLVAANLSFGYTKSDLIIEDWSEQFNAGEMVALAGASGRGKSTLLYLLGLMLGPLSGEIMVFGRNVTRLSDASRAGLRARNYGFVFQDAVLDSSRTVLDNVVETALYSGLKRDLAVARAHDLLRQFGVETRSDHKPGQISGGQAQRIALCRGLMGNPPLLLADEPTGNLDAESSRAVIDALRQRALEGGTVVVATHDPRVMDSCDRVIGL